MRLQNKIQIARRLNLMNYGIEILQSRRLMQVVIFFCSTMTGFAAVPNLHIVSKIYFADANRGTINRANLDGSGLETLVSTGLDFPTNITIDPYAGHLYWVDGSLTRKVYRSNLDGTSVEVIVTVPQTSGVPTGVALDLVRGYIFYSAASSAVGVQRMPLDGSGTSERILTVDSITDMEVDPVNGKLYFGDYHTNDIRVANIDGSGVQVLVANSGHAAGLALDAVNGQIYWALNVDHKIQSSNLDGTNVKDILNLSGSEFPQDVAVDSANGFIYWTDPERDLVQRAKLDGSNRTVLISGLGSPVGIALGPAAAIPEPSALTLLCLGSVCLLRRR